MQSTKWIFDFFFVLTGISDFVLDPSPPLQVRDLLADHCDGCTLKSCEAKTAVCDAQRKDRAS